MNPLLFVSLFFALTASCTSATSLSADEYRDNLLSGIQAQLQSSDYLKGEFVQRKHLTEIDFPLTSTGHFEIWRDERIIWNVVQPISSQLTITPDTLAQKGQSGELFKASTAEQPIIGLIAKIFFSTLSGNWGHLEQHFEISGENAKHQWYVTLNPKSIGISNLIKNIDVSGNHYIEKLVIDEPSGDRTEILFSDVVAQ